MTKSSGLGQHFYVDGYDLSNDVGSIENISCPSATLDVTGLDKFAFERIYGLRDGLMEFMAFFNPASAKAHDVLSTLPTTDRIATFFHGEAIGNPAASLVAKQVNYDPTRGDDGMFTFANSHQGSYYGLEWGEQLTAGTDTLGSAGALTSYDYGVTIGTTAFGLQAYLQVLAFTGTSATVAIQHSSDNGAGDAFANVTGGVFAAATAIGVQRIQTSRTESIERYLRVNVTGTFSNLVFAVMVCKNQSTVVF